MDEALNNFPRRDMLKPVSELNRNDFELVLDAAIVRHLQPRTLITKEDDALVYLLEGEASLLSGGFVVEHFIHSDARALLPMFDETREEDSALVTSHSTILEIDQELFNGLYAQKMSTSGADTAVVSELEEAALFEHLLGAFKQGRIPLLTLSDTALKIRQVINTPGVSSKEIIEIVQMDPGLSARLIKVANSALYGTWREIGSVRDAVRRLGLENTRNLSFSLSVKQLFSASTSLIRGHVQSAYDESVSVSALAFVISKHCARDIDPEQALLAGLVQNLGIIPVLKYIDEHPQLVSNIDVLNKSLSNLRVPISKLLLSQWNFSDDFIEVVEQADNWNRDSGKPPDLADIVIAARLIYLQQKGKLDENLNIEQLPLMKKMNLFDDEDKGGYFFGIAQQEVNDMQQLLRT